MREIKSREPVFICNKCREKVLESEALTTYETVDHWPNGNARHEVAHDVCPYCHGIDTLEEATECPVCGGWHVSDGSPVCDGCINAAPSRLDWCMELQNRLEEQGDDDPLNDLVSYFFSDEEIKKILTEAMIREYTIESSYGLDDHRKYLADFVKNRGEELWEPLADD